ncbi:MAG: RNA-binding domain-containing protein, partial [Phascolarctobacterium sp.]
MDIKDFEKALSAGEGYHVEFKSWKEAGGQKACVKLAVPELIAFANADGGTVYLGVEDKTGEVTGCDDYDCQNIIEAIYDKTRPPLFVKAEEIDYKGKIVIGLSVENDGIRYTTTDGRCLRRLGKNSKPYYPEEMGNRYSRSQSADFSSRILSDSTVNDIDLLAVYDLKEKLSRRNPDSSLAQMEALPLLRDLQLLVDDNGVDRLNVAGLLFVGKESSIKSLLPQMEVIYLKYDERNLEEYSARIDLRQPILKILDRLTEKVKDDNHIVNVQVGLFRLEIEDYSEAVFQEALLNALAHRDYESQGAVYVRRYPNRIVIENPGGFPEGISKYNIITHPSIPRNKLIAETLQHLKYVQRTGQGVDIIYKDMVLTGKPYPEYSVYNDAVKLVLHSQVEDFDFVRFITQEQDKNEQSLTLADLMIVR